MRRKIEPNEWTSAERMVERPGSKKWRAEMVPRSTNRAMPIPDRLREAGKVWPSSRRRIGRGEG